MLKLSDDNFKKVLDKINKWYKDKKDNPDIDFLEFSKDLEEVKKKLENKEVKASVERICSEFLKNK